MRQQTPMSALLHKTFSFPYLDFGKRRKRENQFRGNIPVEIKDTRKKEKWEEGKDSNKTDHLKGGPTHSWPKLARIGKKSLMCSSNVYFSKQLLQTAQITICLTI